MAHALFEIKFDTIKVKLTRKNKRLLLIMSIKTPLQCMLLVKI